MPPCTGTWIKAARHTFTVLQLSAHKHFISASKSLGQSTFTPTLDVYGDPETRPEEGNVVPLRARTYSGGLNTPCQRAWR